ncbi:MAG TPA: divalent-cation tolerance protein CutA [Candidatus Nitrosotenuis sp.]|jgi:periplasmic divalent cation tolerance protein|nr:divalent-cation tolerance protein CutA [Candidatus Nitrosotenuis sp.]
MSTCEFSICYITCPDMEEARSLGRTLVEERLAACVNLVPGVTSFYWWEGRVQEDSEVLLRVKTRSPVLPRLMARVRELHSYSVPMVVATPIHQGNSEYLEWLGAEVPLPAAP